MICTYYCVFVEVRGQIEGLSSFLPQCEFQRSKLRSSGFPASTFTHWSISSALTWKQKLLSKMEIVKSLAVSLLKVSGRVLFKHEVLALVTSAARKRTILIKKENSRAYAHRQYRCMQVQFNLSLDTHFVFLYKCIHLRCIHFEIIGPCYPVWCSFFW